ncbi:unannotated protein [freshwater metagenome]|uniref:Unannotated protein n=1 Tax=freshwater metagenome TaxID=449393 RepID=A0A6J6J3K3_9ZZZZ|nr:glutaredoxin family protein [Actinomycetota bacterium]
MNIELTLIGKPGCHLCEDAEAAIDRVLATFLAANPSVSVSIAQQNVLDDAELAARYSEEIPVLLINGKVHNYWRIDEERFIGALNDLVAAAAE